MIRFFTASVMRHKIAVNMMLVMQGACYAKFFKMLSFSGEKELVKDTLFCMNSLHDNRGTWRDGTTGTGKMNLVNGTE
ncbi:MAG: hypothetical protein K9K75_01835 [Deltaproteobacteria bacterium]|nr:hypothetical protein [Deltaproteobacteria bacterium]